MEGGKKRVWRGAFRIRRGEGGGRGGGVKENRLLVRDTDRNGDATAGVDFGLCRTGWRMLEVVNYQG